MPQPMQCRHVFTDGHRCLGHCLRREDFCYFHHTSRRPVQNPSARRRRSTTFTLPELEDRAAIQLALSEILQRIASNDLDPKRAGHLLYGLQIATSLLPREDPRHQPHSVAEITHDEELGDLAPAQEVGADKEPSEWDAMLLRMQEIQNRPEEPLPVLNLQAAADSNLTPHTSNPHAKPLFAGTSTKPLRVPPCPPQPSRSPYMTSPEHKNLSGQRRSQRQNRNYV